MSQFRFSNLPKYPDKRFDVPSHVETERGLQRALAQLRVEDRIAQASHDRVGESARGRRISRCEFTIDAVVQPFRDAADVERRSGDAEPAGFWSDKAERLRPQARHNQQVGFAERDAELLRIHPAWHSNIESAIPGLRPLRFSLQFSTIRAVADENQIDLQVQRRGD